MDRSMDFKRRKNHHKEASTVTDQNPSQGKRTFLQPKSLFNSCLQFIALRLDLVESLIDFPDDVGKQIFEIAEKMEQFHDSPQRVHLFSDAYSSAVLRKVSLHECHLALGQKLEYFTIFLSLEYLDISNCWLGEDHEIFHHLARLENLTHLNLAENNLSDYSIQKMTSRIRMYKCGPKQLKYLEISGNPQLTMKCIKYLMIFKSLNQLSISFPTKRNQTNLQEIDEKLKLTKCKICEKLSWSNEGWAAKVVQKWMNDSSVGVGVRPPEPFSKSNKMPFYRQSHKELKPISSQDMKATKIEDHMFCFLHRTGTDTSLKKQLKPSNVNNNEVHLDEDFLAGYLGTTSKKVWTPKSNKELMSKLGDW